MKNPVNKIMIGLSLFCVAVASIPSFAQVAPTAVADGGNEGNGGDAVMVNGELVLRDLVDSGAKPITQGTKEYLEAQPGFMALIREIAVAEPGFALKIWNDLVNTTIWFIDGPLPLLPASQTSIGPRRAEVQYGIRVGNDVFFSTPALARISTPFEYALLHESLHGVMGTKDALGHDRVRTMVKFIADNRGNLSEKGILNVARVVSLPLWSTRDYTTKDEFTLLQRLIADTTGSAKLCKTFALVTDAASNCSASPFNFNVMTSWQNLGSCTEKRAAVMKEFFATYPALAGPNIMGHYSIPTERPIDFKNSRVGRELLGLCQTYADPSHQQLRQDYLADTQNFRVAYDSLLNSLVGRDDDEAVFIRIAVKVGNIRGYLSIEGIRGDSDVSRGSFSTTYDNILIYSATYQDNAASCARIFGHNYMTKTKP